MLRAPAGAKMVVDVNFPRTVLFVLHQTVSRTAAIAFSILVSLPNVRISTSSLLHDMAVSTAQVTEGVGTVACCSMTGKCCSMIGMQMAFVRLGKRCPPHNAAGRRLVNASRTAHHSRFIRRWLTVAPSGALKWNPVARQPVKDLFPLHLKSPGEFLLRRLPPQLKRNYT